MLVVNNYLASLERFELPTHGVEDRCTIHCATATFIWCGYRDSNSENSDFKSDMYTNSIISALIFGAPSRNRTYFPYGAILQTASFPI